MFCSNCGQESKEGVFCSKCGASLVSGAAGGKVSSSGDGKGWAIAGLVLGIISLLSMWFLIILGVIFGIAGILCARKGLKSSLSGMAKWGLGLSITGLAISLIFWGLVCLIVL